MVEAMSKEFVAMIPPSMGPYLAPITALVSMPLTFFMSNDAFFYGVLPILLKRLHIMVLAQKLLLVHQL
jgi:CitMHS family citrate-Mg2+:H+ or citrate-Ca2+:H+ symporter